MSPHRLVASVLAITGIFAISAVGAFADFDDCAKTESSLIARWPRVAYRDAKGLHLRLLGKREKVLSDNPEDGEAAVTNFFCGYFEGLDDVLVLVHGYESYAFTLVNRATGAEVTTNGSPLISPDKTRAIAISMDTGAGIDPNVIQIVSLRGGNLRMEAVFHPESYREAVPAWGPASAQWLDTHTLRIARTSEASSTSPNNAPGLDPWILKFSKGAWHIFIERRGPGKVALAPISDREQHPARRVAVKKKKTG